MKVYKNCGETRLTFGNLTVQPGDTFRVALPDEQETFLKQIGAIREIPAVAEPESVEPESVENEDGDL